jgi:hypothetical protein
MRKDQTDPKISHPERVGSLWRIRRHDGVLVGWYATKAIAQKAIDDQAWLQ